MPTEYEILTHNKTAWNKLSERGYIWTRPVESKVIEDAKNGVWIVFLTPSIPVPKEWFPSSLQELKILGLASGGGQQCPIFAAAGADVTVFDNSPAQLAADLMVAERDSLKITAGEGDMADLSRFADNSFDLIFHPVSNSFVPDVNPVWREAFRVLKPGGILLSGFINPLTYLFDENKAQKGIFEVVHRIPFFADRDLSKEELRKLKEDGDALEFSHTLEDQIGGQMKAGFLLTDLYEDKDKNDPLADYIPIYIATRAVKPAI